MGMGGRGAELKEDEEMDVGVVGFEGVSFSCLGVDGAAVAVEGLAAKEKPVLVDAAVEEGAG